MTETTEQTGSAADSGNDTGVGGSTSGQSNTGNAANSGRGGRGRGRGNRSRQRGNARSMDGTSTAKFKGNVPEVGATIGTSNENSGDSFSTLQKQFDTISHGLTHKAKQYMQT